MPTTPTPILASRRHVNGMVATVASDPIRLGEYEFTASFGLDYSGQVGRTRTLEEAKRGADRLAMCPEPCECPPWVEA